MEFSMGYKYIKEQDNTMKSLQLPWFLKIINKILQTNPFNDHDHTGFYFNLLV